MTVREAWDAIARAETEAFGDHLTFASVSLILDALIGSLPTPETAERNESLNGSAIQPTLAPRAEAQKP